MNCFRFEIPKGLDYSPSWHGTMPHCPKDVIVHLYNDKEGYGIAETPDKVTQKELTVLDKVDVLTQLSAVKDEEGVFIGDKLLTRWDAEVDDGR